jgi:hypothetical protein
MNNIFITILMHVAYFKVFTHLHSICLKLLSENMLDNFKINQQLFQLSLGPITSKN